MAGKVSHISNKPTGAISLYNPDNGEWYVATCDINGVMQIQGLVSGQIAIETGHGKTLLTASSTIASATTTATIAAGGSGIVTYVYGVKITGVSAAINRVTIKKGTTQVDIANIQSIGDATCGYSQIVEPDGYIFATAASEAVNIVTSSAESIDYQLLYWQE